MSLIREALEKARRETPRRTQSEPRYPENPAMPAGAGQWRTRRQARAWPWLLIVGLASLAIGVGATRLWNGPLPAATPGVTPTTADGRGAPATASPAPIPMAAMEPTAGETPVASPRAASRSQSPAPPTAPEPPAGLAPSAPSPAPPPAPRRARNSTPAAPELRLDGIVSSATSPVAMINGLPVGIGEFVGGYRVLRISGQEVEVERDGVRVILRLR